MISIINKPLIVPMLKSCLIKGLIGIVIVDVFLLAIFCECAALVYDPTSSKKVANPVSVPTERWKVATDKPEGTIGNPYFRSVIVNEGIVYVHTEESYSEIHGDNYYDFDAIYAFNELSGSRMWVFKDQDDLDDEPTLVDETLFVSDTSNLYAIDAVRGIQKWNYTVKGGIAWYLPPIDGVICCGVENTPSSNSICYVSAVNQVTGEEVWRHEFGYNYDFVQPAIGGGVLCFGTDDSYYAYSLNNGDERWSVEIGDLTGFYVDKQAPFANDKIYMTTGKTVFAINVRNGDKVWSFSPKNYQFMDSPYVAGGHVYAIGYKAIYTGPNAYALDAATGKQLWNYSISGYWSMTNPFVNYGIVTFEHGGPNYCGLDATNGQQVWNQTRPGMIVNNGGGIYSYDPIDYILQSWNPINGNVIWSFKLSPTTIENWYGYYYSYFLGEADNIAYFSAYSYFFAVNLPPVNLPTSSPTAEASSTPISTAEIPSSRDSNLQSQILSQWPVAVAVIFVVVFLSVLITLRRKVIRKRP